MKKVLLVFAFFAFGLAQVSATHPDQPKALNAPEKVFAQKLTKAGFLEKVMDYEKNPNEWVYKGQRPCLIDFYADWCGPCRITAPILEELAKEYYGKIDVYKVDVDVEKELAAVFGVRGIPAFLYCPMEGKPSMTSGIARSNVETKKMFKDNIEKMLLIMK